MFAVVRSLFAALFAGIALAGAFGAVAAEGAEVVYIVAPNGWFGAGSLYARESIPYFAAHPPVYYSHVMPRAYGGSPYADLPAVRTSQAAPPPRVVRNAHVANPQEVEHAPVRPLRIRNPYVSEELSN